LNRFTLMVGHSDKRVNTVFLSLGSNLGERLQNLKVAIAQIQKIALKAVRISGFYESEPWGNLNLAGFLNCVLEVKVDQSPQELLVEIQHIEKIIGRTVKSKNGEYSNRVIDIDILTFNNKTINSIDLTIPHPLMNQRKFVLLPLAELENGVFLPYDLNSPRHYLKLCLDGGGCKRLTSIDV
jgi:2-amino-4-hydroxy-6-hydroxymethyldihydropteridine diphosphokinase